MSSSAREGFPEDSLPRGQNYDDRTIMSPKNIRHLGVIGAGVPQRSTIETSSAEYSKSNWEEYARCRGMDTNIFYGEAGIDPASETAMAKAECAKCPVVEFCLEYALEKPEDFGVWGGKTLRERKKIIRRQAKQENSA